jgi:hypothetical protein
MRRHRFPGEKPADQLYRFADGHGRSARVHAQLAKPAHAGAEPEHGALIGNSVQGGHGHGRERRVA